MAQQLKKGDKVEWRAGQGMTTGTVQKRITQSTEVDGQTVSASADDPRYLVKNDSTGKVTGHKPDSLSEVDDTTGSKSDSSDRDQHIKEFKSAVNMTAKQIEDWLKTDHSKSVGQKDANGKIKGRKSGQHIVKILNKAKSDYTDDDIQHMRKVVSYVHRHTAQRPSGDITETDWRYSLMNWGHDPTKD